MNFKIITLGCKVNTYESEIMRELLLQNNYQETTTQADIVIINTCSVTNMADTKSKKMIRRARRENFKAIIVVCGCMSENEKENLKNLEIDILIGNKDKSRIVELIKNYQMTQKRYSKFYDTQNLEFEDMTISKFSTQTRAFVKIQDGCNNYCSYCIIPYVRGNIRYKDINKAYDEVLELVRNGHKEVVFTGIHTGSYGRGTQNDLVALIKKVSNVEGLKRIRISSIEITEINDKFLNELKNNHKLCNHMHIPLQAGSDEILSLMLRKYSKDLFLKKIEQIRNVRPEISISTDVIVGFPGETETNFNETIKFCKELEFSKIHVFPYSKRQGTKAYVLPNHLSVDIKKRRSKELILVSKTLEDNYNKKFFDQELEVLIEEVHDKYSIGHTSNLIKVMVKEILVKNEIYKIKIKGKEKGTILGERML